MVLDDEDEDALIESVSDDVRRDARAPVPPPVVTQADEDEIIGAATRGIRDEARSPAQDAFSALTRDPNDLPEGNIFGEGETFYDPIPSGLPGAQFTRRPGMESIMRQTTRRNRSEGRDGFVDPTPPTLTAQPEEPTPPSVATPPAPAPAAQPEANQPPQPSIVDDDGDDSATMPDNDADDDPVIAMSGRGARPIVHGTTPDELVALERGERRDKRRRITANVFGALGLLGGIAGGLTGNEGLLELGLGTAGAAKAGRNTNRMRDEARDEIEARRAREIEDQQRFDQDEQRSFERSRMVREDERSEESARMSAALNQARIDGLISEQEQQELDRVAQQGNTDAARATLRARVEAIQHGPTREAWMRQLDPMLSASDPDQLLRQTAFVAPTDIRRGGQGAGGSGGGARRGVDAEGRSTIIRSGPRAAAATPRVPAGAPRPQATPTEAPPSDPERAEFLSAMREAVPDMTAAEFDIALPALRRYGMTAEQLRSPEGQGAARSMVQSYRDAGSGGQSQLQREASETYARGLNEGGLPPHLDRNFYTSVSGSRPVREATEQLRQIRDLSGLLNRASPEQITAALHGGAAMSRVAGAAALRRSISEYMNVYYHDLGGANITPDEARRYTQAFGSDSVVVNPNEFRSAISRYRRLAADRLSSEFRLAPDGRGPEYLDYYYTRAVSPRRSR